MNYFELKFLFTDGYKGTYKMLSDGQTATELARTISNYADMPYTFWGFVDKDGYSVYIKLSEVLSYEVKEVTETNNNIVINKCKDCVGKVTLCDDPNCLKNNSNYDIPF